ncbi:MAG: archaellin/type IV pilin N-terminal domain-containing protein [Candidatus Heimdallarchaeota archaeon]
MLKTMKKIIRKRKAVSPVIATILLIALTVVSVALVYFVAIPYFNSTQLFAFVKSVSDTNKDSRYDQIEIMVTNGGSNDVEITSVHIWSVRQGLLGDQDQWIRHEDWELKNPEANNIAPSKIKEMVVEGTDQIELSIDELTFYRLEIEYTGQKYAYISDWKILNDEADFADLLSDFEAFDLQAWGLEGSIDVPGWASNNYNSVGGNEYGPLIEGQNNYLPVINETSYVPFYITGKIIIFHSTNGNLTGQPTVQQINRTDDPFRARKFFILGLAGSWGDEFPAGATALTLNITYTDGSSSIWEMGHEYIDDWWYNSNPGRVCISAPSGYITEIDLGRQSDSPNQPIHSHTAGFVLDMYKYIQYITFVDPGNDASGPHLLSITAG